MFFQASFFHFFLSFIFLLFFSLHFEKKYIMAPLKVIGAGFGKRRFGKVDFVGVISYFSLTQIYSRVKDELVPRASDML